MKKKHLVFLFLLYGLSVQAQKERVFTAEQLRNDFQFLKESFDKYNPALGVFHPTDDYEALYDSLYNSLNDEMTDVAFYPYLVQLGAATKEGHTFISSSDTISNIFKGFFNGSFSYFPLSIRCIDERIYIWGNFSADSTLQRGDEILRINGEEVGSIMQRLQDFVIADGDITSSKKTKAESSFASHYFWFIDQPEKFVITYRSQQSSTVQKARISALPRDSMITWRNARYGPPASIKESKDIVYTFDIKDGIATLDLNTFNRQQKDKYKIKPKKLYKEIFTQLAKEEIEHLVIDVRSNTGGRREFAKHLLPYLMKRDYSGVIYQDVSWKGKVNKKRFPKKSKRAFKGQVYVLTNATTFSNGSVVTIYAKEYGDAIVIGQEPGSRYEGFAAGSTQYVVLPNTKIKVGIPRYLIQNVYPSAKTKLKNRGIVPDYPIEYSFSDLLEKKDKEKEKAMELIKEISK